MIIFDLDDTIYLHRDFIKQVYRELSLYLDRNTGLTNNEVYQSLISSWDEKGSNYGKHFDDVLKLHSVYSKDLLEGLLNTYFQYKPVKLKPFPDAIGTLSRLRDDYVLALVTDGHMPLQASKLEALGAKDLFDFVVFTRDFGRDYEKPHPLPFEMLLKQLKCRSEEVIAVGDSPKKDILVGNRMGMHTIRMLKGEYAKYPAKGLEIAHYNVKSYKQLLEYISNI